MFFPGEDSIQSMRDLYKQVREYLSLQKELTMITLTEKLTILLSAIVLTIVLILLLCMALLYLSFTMAYVLEPYTGGLAQSFGIITAVVAFLALAVYAFRGKLIYRPITRFIANLFMTGKEEENNGKE